MYILASWKAIKLTNQGAYNMKIIPEPIAVLMHAGFDLYQIKAAFEDGAWLASVEIEQEDAEAYHAIVLQMIKNEVTL